MAAVLKALVHELSWLGLPPHDYVVSTHYVMHVIKCTRLSHSLVRTAWERG